MKQKLTKMEQRKVEKIKLKWSEAIIKTEYKNIMKQLLKELKLFDKNSDRVTSKENGKSTMLTPRELAVYDYMLGLEYFEFLGNQKLYKTHYEACKWWFLKKNPKAYLILLIK